MSHSASLKEKLRYRFDNFMAKGGSSIFLSLLVIFVVMFIVIAVFRALLIGVFPDGTLERGEGFLRNTYITFLQMTDPGNMAQDITTSGWYKIATVVSGFTGIVLFSSLIAFITTALDKKMLQLKKGHSRVIEEDHTLILGWNERVVEILAELFEANESEDDPVVVILADKDKEEMDDFLALHVPDTRNTRVVTRSGVESSLINLEIASVATSKSVIVLAKCNVSAPEKQIEESDFFVIKTIMGLIASRPDDVQLNIVAEVFQDRNRELVDTISPEEITTVDSNEILAKILVQTSRSEGLAVVYGEVLSFDGCEMYFYEADWKAGSKFGELAFHFPDGVPLGLRHADGSISINPAADLDVKPDDAVLILAEDDSTIDYRPQPLVTPREIALSGGRKSMKVERELIIGWTKKIETVIREYHDYVLEGSEIDVMLRSPDDAVRGRIAALDAELTGITLRLVEGDPTRTEGLLAINPTRYDNIIILSQSAGGTEDDDRADSETLIILLLLRNIFRELDPAEVRTKLITEVLDSSNQTLITHTGVKEFIISNRFISMLLAQISENRDIKRVYDDLFSEDGSEIYLKPLTMYLDELPAVLTFGDIIRLAQKREEIAIGVKIKALEGDADQNFGVQLIPEKSASFTLGPEDTIVVVSEDET